MGNKFLLSFCLWISPLLLLFTGNSKSCFLGVPQVLPLTPPHFPSPSPLHVSAPQWSASPHSPGERLFYLPFQANSSLLSISFPPASAALCLTNNHHINYHSHYCVFDVYIWQLPPWLEPLRALVWAITIAPSPISLVPLGHFQGPPYKIYVKYWHFSAVHPLVHLSLLREKAKFLTPSYLGPHDLCFFSYYSPHTHSIPATPAVSQTCTYLRSFAPHLSFIQSTHPPGLPQLTLPLPVGFIPQQQGFLWPPTKEQHPTPPHHSFSFHFPVFFLMTFSITEHTFVYLFVAIFPH